MGNSYNENQNERRFDNRRDSARGNFKDGRGPNGRDAGGFRIRLSDNEMRAAKTIQEAFNLRSTVAVLGFSIRTLAQMLEEGKLNEMVSEYRSQNTNNESFKIRNNSQRRINDNASSEIPLGKAKPNPFARPEKPPITKQEESIEEENNNEQDQTDIEKNNQIEEQENSKPSSSKDENEQTEPSKEKS